MATSEQISEWKEKYKFVLKTTIVGKEYYFRTLSREDYISILMVQASNPTVFDHDIEVFKKCILSEYDADELKNKAGIATVISEKIMIASGFENTETEEV